MISSQCLTLEVGVVKIGENPKPAIKILYCHTSPSDIRQLFCAHCMLYITVRRFENSNEKSRPHPRLL